MVIGRTAVLEAIRNGQALDRVYINNKAVGEEISAIRNLATRNSIPVNYVPVEKLNGFNIENHEGVVALISKIRYQDLHQIISFLVEK